MNKYNYNIVLTYKDLVQINPNYKISDHAIVYIGYNYNSLNLMNLCNFVGKE